MTRLQGQGVGTGTGTGPAVWLDQTVTTTTTGNEPDRVQERELERFAAAREAAIAELESEQTQAASAVGKPGADVLATHESFLTDPALEERVEAELADGTPAARAVATAIEAWIDVFEARGGRTAARADDLRDLRGRLLRHLGRADPHRDIEDVPANAVLLADRLHPSVAAQLSRHQIAGVATKRGSPVGHAAVLARAAGVPLVVAVTDDLDGIDAGQTITVDADAGVVTDDEPATVTDSRKPGRDTDSDTRPSGSPLGVVTTAEGAEIRIAANVGSGREARDAASRGAAGVALFRSEVLAYQTDGIPSVSEQAAAYTETLDAFPGETVAIRTFDFGGDKPLPGDVDSGDGNGGDFGSATRGIARSLTTGSEFDEQLHALCRAQDEGAGSLVVLLPHVTSLDQVERAQERLTATADRLETDTPDVGVMVETPAAVSLAPELAATADVLSLGTNDLLAGLYGQPRDGPGDRAPESPAFLRALLDIADAAADSGTPLSCCGDLAADPPWAKRLAAIGVDTLGVPSRELASIATAVDGLAVDAIRDRMRTAAAASTNSEVGRILTDTEGG